MKTARDRLLLSAVAMVLLGGGLVWLLGGGCSIDREISKPLEKRDLSRDEIRAKLTSSEFRDKLAGEKQIEKLSPEERLSILLGLSQDADPAVRLIAVKHLAKMDHPQARDRRAQMAASDPDPTVRELAAPR